MSPSIALLAKPNLTDRLINHLHRNIPPRRNYTLYIQETEPEFSLYYPIATHQPVSIDKVSGWTQ
jgi:hypothetical protein